MFCPKCGAELQNEVKFCPKCGVEMTNGIITTENTAEIEESVPQDKENPEKKSSILSNIISIIVVIVFLWILISGVKWVFSSLHSAFTDNNNGTGTQASDDMDANDLIH